MFAYVLVYKVLVYHQQSTLNEFLHIQHQYPKKIFCSSMCTNALLKPMRKNSTKKKKKMKTQGNLDHQWCALAIFFKLCTNMVSPSTCPTVFSGSGFLESVDECEFVSIKI